MHFSMEVLYLSLSLGVCMLLKSMCIAVIVNMCMYFCIDVCMYVCMAGDSVVLELSAYDLTRGRITFRNK